MTDGSMIDALLAWLKTCEPEARWRGEDLASWTSFSIQRDVHHGEGLARLAAMPLTRLQISGDYRAEELAPLAALGATVEQLRLHVPTLDDFTPFAGWERLHTLDVSYMTIGSDAVRSLGGCGALRNVQLVNCTLAPDAVGAFAAVRALERLDMSTSKTKPTTTSVALGPLGALPRLRELSCGVELAVSDPSLDGLAAATALRSLDVWGARLTEAAADTLSALELTNLRLGSAPWADDAALAPLARRPGLQRLSLSGARNVTGAFLASLAERPELSWLELSGCGLDDTQLEPLARCEVLEWLSLAGTSVGDRALRPLARLTRLRRLDLTDTKVTAEGLATLPRAIREVVEVRDDEARLRRATRLAAKATAAGDDYLALRIQGTVGHAHFDETLVHGDPQRFWAALEESFGRPVGPLDLEPGLEQWVLVYRGGVLERSLDVRPALRVHEVRPDGSFGRGARLDALQGDAARRAKILARMEQGIEHRLSILRAALRLPESLPRPLAEGKSAVVPEWLDLDGDDDEEAPPRVVPTGWS